MYIKQVHLQSTDKTLIKSILEIVKNEEAAMFILQNKYDELEDEFNSIPNYRWLKQARLLGAMKMLLDAVEHLIYSVDAKMMVLR